MLRRVGLLGGAFNPPHLGHLKLAHLALAHLALDELRFVPTAVSPHKPSEPTAAAARLVLLLAALEDTPFRIETAELDRAGISYTVDTLDALSRREPDCAWILVMGADQAAGLAGWRRIDRILELASVAVAPRPGEQAEIPAALQSRLRTGWSGAPGELVQLPGTELDLSSSGLREALRKRPSPDGLPPQVLAAIRRENLYR